MLWPTGMKYSRGRQEEYRCSTPHTHAAKYVQVIHLQVPTKSVMENMHVSENTLVAVQSVQDPHDCSNGP